jgi:hypothetical protein
VKSSGKQSNQLTEISDYIGNRKEMEDSKSVLVGSPIGQNEPPVPSGSQTQPREPIGDKNRIASRVLKRAICADLGNDRGEVVWVPTSPLPLLP